MIMNKLMIAAAGSGKTTFLVNEALKINDEKVLITTFTDANENEIRKKFLELNGYGTIKYNYSNLVFFFDATWS